MGLTPGFWRGRRVLLTGHTGFKGAWLGLWLERLGAEVTGFALAPPTEPSLFALVAPWPRLASLAGDVRDADAVATAVARAAPEVVFHLAAQSLVRAGHRAPVETFAVNVVGTATVLEALAGCETLRAAVVATSDKCYANDGTGRAFAEDDALGGDDAYAASKACQDIAARTWRDRLGDAAALATARAGNVIGGGDWAADRLLPDVFRALAAGEPVRVRHPEATRPWQHVLDPLAGYLLLAEALAAGAAVPPALNFGPDPGDVRPVSWVVGQVLDRWGESPGWEAAPDAGPPEAPELVLDSRRAAETLGWRPRLALDEALDWAVAWHRAYAEGGDLRALSLDQIARYEARLGAP